MIHRLLISIARLFRPPVEPAHTERLPVRQFHCLICERFWSATDSRLNCCPSCGARQYEVIVR